MGRFSFGAGAALIAASSWIFAACANSDDGASDDPDAGPIQLHDSGKGPSVIDSSPANPTGEPDAGSDASDGAPDPACAAGCPGEGQTTANVACVPGTGCTFSCKGESYDVDDDASDGCEKADTPTGNHVQMAATSSGDWPCSSTADDQVVLKGIVPSDKRAHENPAVLGFVTQSGAAPDFFSVKGTGGALCRNQLSFSFTVAGSTQAACYKLTIVSDKKTLSCSPTTGESCKVDGDSSGNYSSDSLIYFTVEKTCGTVAIESASYTVSGHL